MGLRPFGVSGRESETEFGLNYILRKPLRS
jgi:hypothetical protein